MAQAVERMKGLLAASSDALAQADVQLMLDFLAQAERGIVR